MFNVIKLFNFFKVYPLSLLSSIFFFGMLATFAMKVSSTVEGAGLLVGAIILFILFIFSFVFQARFMALKYMSDLYDDDDIEEANYRDVLSEISDYAKPIFLLTLIYVLNYNLIIPTIADLAGGLFQISLFGADFNLLTLIINCANIIWLFFGVAEIVCVDATFTDTLKFTFAFVFNNLLKIIGFLFLISLILFLFNLTLLYTHVGNQLIMMPIKIIAFGYLFSLCNSLAISMFVNNVTQEDLSDNDDEEVDEDEE